MYLQQRRDAFAARTIQYQQALANGQDIFAKFLNEDQGEPHDGALVHWFEQQPEPEFKQAASDAVECCI